MVDQVLFQRYRDALGATADLAKTLVSELVEKYSGRISAVEMGDVYAQLCVRLGSAAAQSAMEFYKAQRALDFPDENADSIQLPEPTTTAAELAVQAQRTPSAQLAAKAVQNVLGRADETLIQANAQDTHKARYALVPHAGACGWCQLMASRGFDYGKAYRSGEGVRHQNCRCTMIADFDTENPQLEGYDEQYYLGRYKAAREQVVPEARAQWNSMSYEERMMYKAKGRGSYDHFLRNKLTSAMDNREHH